MDPARQAPPDPVDPVPASAASTDLSVLERARRRDPLGWQRLIDLYGPLVIHWCRGYGLRGEDLADIVQEAFLSVSVHLAHFRRDRPTDSFRGWLHRIVRNKVNDHFRKVRGRPEATGGSDAYERLLSVAALDDEDGAATSGPDSRQGLLHRALHLLRDEFEGQTWKAFWQVTVEERSSREVAKELGMTPGAVRKAKSRVLHRLRKEFGDLL